MRRINEDTNATINIIYNNQTKYSANRLVNNDNPKYVIKDAIKAAAQYTAMIRIILFNSISSHSVLLNFYFFST